MHPQCFSPPSSFLQSPQESVKQNNMLSGNSICLAPSGQKVRSQRSILFLAGYSRKVWINQSSQARGLSPPPTPVTARLSSALTFKNTAFTAKREFYGVISNTEIPVKSDTERVGAPGGFLCRGHLKQVGRVSNPAGCWDFTADTTPLIGFKEYVKKIIECSAVISVRGRYQTDINLGLLCYQMERVSRSPLKSHYCLGSIVFLSGVYRQQDIW